MRYTALNMLLILKHHNIIQKVHLVALFLFYIKNFSKSTIKVHYMTLLLIEQIKERRKVLAITQETLADISGVGLRTLKQFESGRGNPTLVHYKSYVLR